MMPLQVDDDLIDKVTAFIGSRLRLLTLAWCDSVGDFGLSLLQQRCPKLELLDVTGNSGISFHALHMFRSLSPRCALLLNRSSATSAITLAPKSSADQKHIQLKSGNRSWFQHWSVLKKVLSFLCFSDVATISITNSHFLHAAIRVLPGLRSKLDLSNIDHPAMVEERIDDELIESTFITKQQLILRRSPAVSDSHFDSIAFSFADLRSLEFVACPNVSDASFVPLIASTANRLEYLCLGDLVHTHLSSVSIDSFGDVWSSNESVKEEMNLNISSAGDSTLSTNHLSSEHNTALEELQLWDLPSSAMTGHVLTRLLTALPRHATILDAPNIRVLRLERGRHSDIDFDFVTDDALRALSHATFLESLSLDGMQSFSDNGLYSALVGLTCLRSLSLQRCIQVDHPFSI